MLGATLSQIYTELEPCPSGQGFVMESGTLSKVILQFHSIYTTQPSNSNEHQSKTTPTPDIHRIVSLKGIQNGSSLSRHTFASCQ
jgi:hypothetical protein